MYFYKLRLPAKESLLSVLRTRAARCSAFQRMLTDFDFGLIKKSPGNSGWVTYSRWQFFYRSLYK